MQNRYPGTCDCGTWVDAGEGEAIKVGSKWTVECAACGVRAKPPEREMRGTIYWPNGMGHTECTIEYEEAVFESQMARRALEDYERDSYDAQEPDSRTERNRLEHAAYAAENKVGELQAEGGHLGERVKYEQADPMAALLGGGFVNVVPGGGMRVAD